MYSFHGSREQMAHLGMSRLWHRTLLRRRTRISHGTRTTTGAMTAIDEATMAEAKEAEAVFTLIIGGRVHRGTPCRTDIVTYLT
jgi:hypothetical protein